MRITVTVLGLQALVFICRCQQSNAQMFEPVQVNLVENTGAGMSLGTFIGSGGTGPYTFSSVSQTGNLDWFTVFGTNDPELGVIVTHGKTVDYEAPELTSHIYKINISVVDSASTTVTVTLTVAITDVNESPAFVSNDVIYKSTTVPPPGTPLLHVGAYDPDASELLSYAIGNTDRYAISAYGFITVKIDATLSVGVHDKFWMTVADDDVLTPLTATGVVTVCISPCNLAAAIAVRSGMVAIAVLVAMFINL